MLLQFSNSNIIIFKTVNVFKRTCLGIHLFSVNLKHFWVKTPTQRHDNPRNDDHKREIILESNKHITRITGRGRWAGW